MSKQRYDEPLPFRLLKKMPKDTWRLCDICMELKNELYWYDYCILPIAGGMSVANSVGMDPTDGYKVSALYAWRKYKEIYSFDPDLADMLIDQADTDMSIPMSILYQLPYPCIYIQFRENGFFVHFEHDVNNGQFELRMWYLPDSTDTGYPLILHIEEECTIDEAMDKTYSEAKKRTTPDIDFMLDAVSDQMKQRAAELLQFVLYICAENSEREEDPKQKTVTRRTPESNSQPKDVFREIRKWNVGYRIGSQIRRANAEQDKPEHSDGGVRDRSYAKGGKKSPHARRGHWHHFWIGKHDTSDRRLILKWVAPIFINGDEDDNIPTIHPVI